MGPRIDVPTVDVRGVRVGRATTEGWVDALSSRVGQGERAHHHVSLNAAKWVAARRDPELRRAILAADSVAADGIAIVWLARYLGTPLPGRGPGIDVAEGLLARAGALRWRVALLGARREVVARVAAELPAHVVLAADGYTGREAEWADAVTAARPDLVLVALGTPRAERFVHRYGSRWPGAVALGVGGAFDVWAGVVPRAPAWSRRAGLEGAARFAREPRRRFSRAIVDSVRFAAAVALGRRVPS